MKNEKLAKALEQVSDEHIEEAVTVKKKRKFPWVAAVAAVLAVAVAVVVLSNPLVLSAKAVSVAKYPKYQWEYRRDMGSVTAPLQEFFTDSLEQTLAPAVQENQIYSPANLYMALCLMGELTNGNEQILALLNAEGQEDLREQAKKIWDACYLDDGDQTLLANSLWLDDSLAYNQALMDTLSENYYTSVYQRQLHSAQTSSDIKSWVNHQTGGLLKNEVNELSLPQDALLVLYSTVYYQAMWTESCEFNTANNTAGRFQTPDDSVTCTFMNQDQLETYYYWAEDFSAVSMHLKDGSSMWLLLPDEDKTTADVVSSPELPELLFDTGEYENSKYMLVNLSMPKFDVRASGDLKADLQALGITDVFTPDSDCLAASFTTDDPLFFTNVNQATRVAVDEKGVTAASYIELPGAGAGMPPEEEIDFTLDRPFVFVITNRYDIPLFAGVVNKP